MEAEMLFTTKFAVVAKPQAQCKYNDAKTLTAGFVDTFNICKPY
jgi:hypothetical protein